MQLYLLENKKHHNPLSVKGVNTENYHSLKKRFLGSLRECYTLPEIAGLEHQLACVKNLSFKELRI